MESSEETSLETNVQDVSGMTVGDMIRLDAGHRDALAETQQRVNERANNPGRTISGYNPQRLTD